MNIEYYPPNAGKCESVKKQANQQPRVPTKKVHTPNSSKSEEKKNTGHRRVSV
jgi:hypothetical protein